MKLEFNKERAVYILERDDGTWTALSLTDVSFIIDEARKSSIRSRIQYEFENAVEEEWIDLSESDLTADEFVDEVFEYLKDKIEYQDNVSDNEIEIAVQYIAESYEVWN